MPNPWDDNKLSGSQIVIISDFLADYSQNGAGQTFGFEYSLYDDLSEQRQMFYLRAMMNGTTLSQSKQIPAPDLPGNEVIGFVVADLIRQLELAAYHASIGELGLLGDSPREGGEIFAELFAEAVVASASFASEGQVTEAIAEGATASDSFASEGQVAEVVADGAVASGSFVSEE